MITGITSKIYSTLGSNSSLVPLAIKDIANSAGITAGSYATGKDVEGKDRFIDEFGTQVIWLGGIPFFKKVTDYTLYKILGIDPKFDVRNFKNKDILAKAIEKAPTEKIKQSILKAAENPKYIKNLALTKFAFATTAAIAAYMGLTKFRQNYRLKEAKAHLKQQQSTNSQPQKQILHTTPQAFEGVKLKKGKDVTFGGAIQDFMFNPVKNLMLLDGAITEERLRKSESKQEFINYTIKEGGTWAFMYFAGDIIKKHLEKKALTHNTPIHLDARIIESQELKDAFKLGTIKNSLDAFNKLPEKAADIDIYNFIHENPENFIVKMAKKAEVVKTLKKSEKIDTRKFLDIGEFKELTSHIEELYNKAPKDKIDSYLKKVINTKRGSVFKNMGICIAALGIGVPLMQIASRYILPNNKEYNVMQKAKESLAKEKAA